ncbi:granulocyte-macrophage colony-stimulating factor receptor subunit alpha isoform X2 [Syngnathus scovelli]|uniref:granulocyte-macrophage colony-stimulating factor receptor subunit alpha isoform X2 n=1 Tax=Syngnathus scovelli TaxID=161590 RepID=UPI00210F7409|nr:granulocyte-macrophage colony-stimulating factor receptor subunit alpha isoform X2 [Syngnathus scovelli]
MLQRTDDRRVVKRCHGNRGSSAVKLRKCVIVFRQRAKEYQQSGRLAMKVCPLHPLVCCSLLILWAFQSAETTNAEVCQDEKSIGNLQLLSSSLHEHNFMDIEENNNFNCFLYPTNLLNCSWIFPTLDKEFQLYVHISICDNNSTVQPLHLISKQHSGSTCIALKQYECLYVIIQFNVSLHHQWAVYSYVYDTEMMEVLPPPGNISASVKDKDLVVTWDKPRGRANYRSVCFEYQLAVGNQEQTQIQCCELSHTMPNANLASTYSVKVRTRKRSTCSGSQLWSDWSDTVIIQQSFYTFNITIIVAIAIGIPMILLTLLLLVRNHRVAQVLYPTIPRPPLKYKHFLEENNAFNFYHPSPSVKYEEEITVVEDAEKSH